MGAWDLLGLTWLMRGAVGTWEGRNRWGSSIEGLPKSHVVAIPVFGCVPLSLAPSS